ncbi:hypothetical protein GuL6_108 [Buttiauxella phage vB_ButM_GuL6]|nr:hypothetical protein GuL6_108 [Buttiauxella phage vB_ButM_GuL6]
MNMNYVKCGIMSMLLKEVTFAFGTNSKDVWNVRIGGENIGYIYSEGKKYRAVTMNGYEWECDHFMRALAAFIRIAINELDRQGSQEEKYIGSIGSVDDTNFCFEITEAIYDSSDTVFQYRLHAEDVIKTYFGAKVVNASQYITPFELRYQTLMGFITLA